MQAILNCQYNYLQGRIACRIRAGLTCMVFDKALMLSSAHMADFSEGQVCLAPLFPFLLPDTRSCSSESVRIY